MVTSKNKRLRILSVILSFLLTFIASGDSVVKADTDLYSNADLNSITINEIKISITNPDIYTYNLNMSVSTAIETLIVEAEPVNEKSTVSIGGTNVVNNIAVVNVTVTSQDKTKTKIYYVVVQINGDGSVSSDADLISITINGQKINTKNLYTANYNLNLPANTAGEFLSVETEASNANATISVEGTRIINNSALVKITVTAANKINTRVYYVNVKLKDSEVNNGFVKVRTADFHTLVLKNDGTLYGFGENNYGQLGDGTKTTRISPVQVKNIANVEDFDTSNSHSIAVTSDGTVWIWGLNDFGQLGIDSKKDTTIPTKIEGLNDIVKVRAGNRISIALDKYGHIWTWGYNSKGVDDEAIDSDAIKPSIVNELLKTKIVDIAAGDFHFLSLTDEGKIYSWGANDFGQLGDGTLYNSYTPVLIKSPSAVKSEVKFISANGNTSSCIDKNGNVYYWGENKFDGTNILNETTSVTAPKLIDDISDAKKVEVNNDHIVYVKKNGDIYSKGINKYGQLGNGSTTNSGTFYMIYNLGKINEIDISHYSSFLIDEEGYIYAAGRNNTGQLGVNDTNAYYSSPKKLQSFTASEISAVYANYKSGEVDKDTAVRLGTDTLGGKIYYTLDGSNPTEKSNIYKTPIIINEHTIIKAIAFKDGKYSPVSTFEYVISNKARTEMNISIGTGEGKIGDYVDIPITFSNVPSSGIANLKFAIKYNPEVLTFQSTTYGELISDSSDFSYSKVAEDTILLSFYDNSRTSRNISKNGTFATIKFYIKSNSNKGRYSLAQVYYSEEGVYSKGNKLVNTYYNAGYIDAVDTKSILYGDVDGDSKVTALDMQYIQRYIGGKVTSFPYSNGLEAADIDDDGDIDSNDIELIKKTILGR